MPGPTKEELIAARLQQMQPLLQEARDTGSLLWGGGALWYRPDDLETTMQEGHCLYGPSGWRIIHPRTEIQHRQRIIERHQRDLQAFQNEYQDLLQQRSHD